MLVEAEKAVVGAMHMNRFSGRMRRVRQRQRQKLGPQACKGLAREEHS